MRDLLVEMRHRSARRALRVGDEHAKALAAGAQLELDPGLAQAGPHRGRALRQLPDLDQPHVGGVATMADVPSPTARAASSIASSSSRGPSSTLGNK